MCPECPLKITSGYDWVLLCSDVMDYCSKVNPLENSKNRDSLLIKLVCSCLCVWVCGWMCMHTFEHVCRWVSVCVVGWVVGVWKRGGESV